MNKKKKAFTLVELLVVVAIIALLVSILLPALGQARQAAQKVVCMSFVRQMVLASIGYMSENRDAFPEQHAFRPTSFVNPDLQVNQGDVGHGLTDPDPTYYCWAYRIDPYISWENQPESKCCPSLRNDYHQDMEGTGNVGLSYFANSVLTTFGGHNARRLNNLIAITELFESAYTVRTFPRLRRKSGVSNAWDTLSESQVQGYNWMTKLDGSLWAHLPHKDKRPEEGGRNYGFLDGHAEFLEWQDVTCGMFGLAIDGDRNAQEPIGVGGSSTAVRLGDVVY